MTCLRGAGWRIDYRITFKKSIRSAGAAASDGRMGAASSEAVPVLGAVGRPRPAAPSSWRSA